jgi:hypothetical protein
MLRSPCDEPSFVLGSLRACLPKIKSRILSDRFYLKPGLRLTRLLADWKPKVDDKPFNKDFWVRIRPELTYSLDASGVETRGTGQAKEFCLSNGNLEKWVRIFAAVLIALEVRVEALITSNQPTADAEAEFIHAHGTLYGLNKVFEAYPEIFDNTSLREILLVSFKRVTKNPLDWVGEDDFDNAGMT